MSPDERLDQLIADFRKSPIPEGPPPEVVSQALAALNQERTRPALVPFTERIRRMHPLLRIAAVLLVAAGVVGVLAPERKGPGAAFAGALETVREAHTIVYTMRIGDDPAVYRVLRMEPGLIRTELPDGGVSIADRAQGKSLVLNPRHKTAVLVEAKGAGKIGREEDLIDQLRRFQGKPQEVLGQKTVDGRTARGYRIAAGGWEPVIWVDVKTELPIRMETKTRSNADETKTVYYEHFLFDVPLEESLFSTTPPAGYKTQVAPLAIDQAAPVEKDLVDLFREYAKRSGGRFPNDLQMPSLIDVLKDIKVTEKGFDKDTSDWIAQVGKGVGLVWAMPPDADATYTGKGVTLGQADKPIFRYRPQGAGVYHVIYGDLSVKLVAPAQIEK